MLAVLALLGTQVVFLRAAFPHVSRAATMRVLEQNSDAQAQSSVDEGRLPSRGGRRGGPTVGTSAPVTPDFAEAIGLKHAGRIAFSLQAPASYVPPPLFRPPRAG